MSEESYEEEGTRRRDLVSVCLLSKCPRSIQSADSSIMCGGMIVAARHQHSPLSSTKSLDAGWNLTDEIYPEIKEEELEFGDETMAEACDLKGQKIWERLRGGKEGVPLPRSSLRSSMLVDLVGLFQLQHYKKKRKKIQ